MSIHLKHRTDIRKLIAFLKIHAKNTEFDFPAELAMEIMDAVMQFAKDNNVSIEVITPTRERIMTVTAAGALTGAAVGYIIGSIPGAIIGGVAGSAVGYFAAHYTITINLQGPEGYLTLS